MADDPDTAAEAENAATEGNVFADIFGSDLESDLDENIDANEEGTQHTEPALQQDEALALEEAPGAEGSPLVGELPAEPEDDDDDIGVGKLRQRKRERELERERAREEDEEHIGRKRKKKRKRERERDEGSIKRLKHEGDVEGYGGYEDEVLNDSAITANGYEQDFIDDTGADKTKEDPDDVIRTEGGFEVDSDIEGRSGEEDVKPTTYFQEQMEKMKSSKGGRRKDLDAGAIEDECIAFIEQMMKARDLDIKAYRNKTPALKKLKMLPQVEDILAKVDYREPLLDNMLLTVIKAWLDPMDDGALPNITIRKRLLEVLDGFPVDQDWIEKLQKSQGLGVVINYLSLKDDHEPNRRLAKKLISKWSRPIYQAGSQSYRDEHDGQRGSRHGGNTGKSLALLNEKRRQKLGTSAYMARMPSRMEFNFQHEPESNAISDAASGRRESRRAKKWERAARGMKMAQRRSSYGVHVSVDGRDSTM